jgi:hypothetical protein
VPYAGEGRGLKEKILLVAERLLQQGYQTFKKLNWWQKILAVLALIIINVGGILFLVYSKRIFHWLGPVAESWRALPAGWLIVWLLTFVCAFPPMIGFSPSVTITGFVYGVPMG